METEQMILFNSMIQLKNSEDVIIAGIKYTKFSATLLKEKVVKPIANKEAYFVDMQNFAGAGKYKSWDDTSVILNHPTHMHGSSIEIQTNFSMGRIYDCVYNEKAKTLTANVYLNAEQIEKEGGPRLEALNKIKNGQAAEISLGFVCQIKKANGEYNGQRFTGTFANVRPDHLAILDGNQVGACSLKDGCGVGNDMMTFSASPLEDNNSATYDKTNSNESIGQDQHFSLSQHACECADCKAKEDETSLKKGLLETIFQFLGKNGLTIGKNNDIDDILAQDNNSKEDKVMENKEDKTAETKLTNDSVIKSQVDKIIEDSLGMSLAEVKMTFEGINAEKDELVTSLADNKACPLGKEELKLLTGTALRKLSEGYKAPEEAVGDKADDKAENKEAKSDDTEADKKEAKDDKADNKADDKSDKDKETETKKTNFSASGGGGTADKKDDDEEVSLQASLPVPIYLQTETNTGKGA